MICPNQTIIKNLEKLLFQYIWKGRDRVSRGQLIQNINNGGCNMVHLESFIKALKITWIRRILSSEASWKKLLISNTNLDLKFLTLFGDAYSKDISMKTTNKFWMQVFSDYASWQKLKLDSEDSEVIMKLPIWKNSLIKICGKPILYKSWVNAGIFYLCDFFHE